MQKRDPITLLLLVFHAIFSMMLSQVITNLIMRKNPIFCNCFIRGQIGMKLLHTANTHTQG